MNIDPGLKAYTTLEFAEIIDLINKEGGIRQASRIKNIPESTLRHRVDQIKRKAVLQGYSPEHDMTRTVPDPMVIKRISSNYNSEGQLSQQWVIAETSAQARLQIIIDVITGLKDEILKVKKTKAPAVTAVNLCNLYTFTDYHLGLMTSIAETGTEWDLPKAQQFIIQMFEYMINTSPRAGVAFINQLGDFLHFDNIMPVTPTSGHIVDASARFSDVVRSAIVIIRTMIKMALDRHDKVIVVLAEGNHDITSSIWLREIFAVMYEDEPRVEIVKSDTPYYAYQHGKTMLCFHHGHKKKHESLPLLFAARYAPMWGVTKKRYIHTGHWHHVDEKEFSGCKMVGHPTLAPADAHAVRGGYDSEREATVETYDIEHGRVNRKSVVPEMLLI